ncbi:MAG TPA: acetylxylan esterase [Verrucomicrobiota bacterium]|nr:acetylxylan esterase [Verrucomicrobiota bacterium]HNU52575.1 acetylxylan esterase [Verrucomicrobiota bacterium]
MVGMIPGGAASDDRDTGPWDMSELRKPPSYSAVPVNETTEAVVWEVTDGRRAFGYLSRPSGSGPFPGLLCLSGFESDADPYWSEHYASRGYVALVTDNLGNGPDGQPLPESVLPVTTTNTFHRIAQGERECSVYQSVAAAARAISLLSGLIEVDPDRIGVMGLSWGGVLACTLAGIDDRVAGGVAIYGGAGVGIESSFTLHFNEMQPEDVRRWKGVFDPVHYLHQVRCPVLFVNSDGDSYFSMGTTRLSWAMARGPRALCIRPGLGHGAVYTWDWCQDAEVFLDAHLRGGAHYPCITQTAFGPSMVEAKIENVVGLPSVALYWATNETRAFQDGQGAYWQSREWQGTVLNITNSSVRVALPSDAKAYYFVLQDGVRRAVASTPPLAPPWIPAPVLVGLPRAPGSLGNRVAFAAVPGIEYQIEGSSDLSVWLPLAMLAASSESFVYEDLMSAGPRARYYRATVVP